MNERGERARTISSLNVTCSHPSTKAKASSNAASVRLDWLGVDGVPEALATPETFPLTEDDDVIDAAPPARPLANLASTAKGRV